MTPCWLTWIYSLGLGVVGLVCALTVGLMLLAAVLAGSRWLSQRWERRWERMRTPRVVGLLETTGQVVGLVLVVGVPLLAATLAAHAALYGCDDCRPAWMGPCEKEKTP